MIINKIFSNKLRILLHIKVIKGKIYVDLMFRTSFNGGKLLSEESQNDKNKTEGIL
jgi:hypothetical protein